MPSGNAGINRPDEDEIRKPTALSFLRTEISIPAVFTRSWSSRYRAPFHLPCRPLRPKVRPKTRSGPSRTVAARRRLGNRHVYQVRALQIGWSRADNIDARDLYELADRLYADLSLAALDDFAISQPRADPRWSTSQTHHPADCPHIFRCCGGRPGLENSSIMAPHPAPCPRSR